MIKLFYLILPVFQIPLLSLNELDPFTIYYWRVSAQNQYGSSIWADPIGFRTESVLAVREESKIPADYNLSQNFPNPFNPSTKIRFSLPKSGYVELKVFDILGREVIELVNEEFAPGSYSVGWNGRNNSGVQVPSGLYIYIIRVGEFISSKKMMLIK